MSTEHKSDNSKMYLLYVFLYQQYLQKTCGQSVHKACLLSIKTFLTVVDSLLSAVKEVF